MIDIDIIGALFDPHPTDPEGEPVLLPGFHVNVTSDLMAERPELETFRVEPSPLRRVWAGDDPTNPTITVPLRFADEAEAAKMLPEAVAEPDLAALEAIDIETGWHG